LKKIEQLFSVYIQYPPTNSTLSNLSILKSSHQDSIKMAALFERPIWVFNDDEFPCICCPPTYAMTEDGFWECGDRRWLILDSEPDLTKKHDIILCDGTCGHPLHSTDNVLLAQSYLQMVGWGELSDIWDDEKEAAMSPAERARRVAAASAAAAEHARLAPMEALHRQQMERMKTCRQTALYKSNTGKKVAAPCRGLYDYQREGGCTSLSCVTECWAHEFTDGLSSELVAAATGRFSARAEAMGIPAAVKKGEAVVVRDRVQGYLLRWTPHTCWMSHPGDATWCAEWLENRTFKPRDSRPGAPIDWRSGGGGGTNPGGWRSGSGPVPQQHERRQDTRNFRPSQPHSAAGGGGGGSGSSKKGFNVLTESD
jgi:hypothetical protein